jgi:hypothetical protein
MKISAVNRRLLFPLFVSTVCTVSFTGIIDYVLLKWLADAFHPVMMVPLLLFLADEAFVAGRTGLLIHYHARHTQAGLREFLIGNGAKQFEALLPYYRHVISRTLLLSLWRWVLVSVITFVALCFSLLFGGLSITSALWFFGGLIISAVFCSVATLLMSVFFYDRMNK